MHAPRKAVWQEKLARSRYFFGALLLHIVVFLMVATIVVWKAPVPPAEVEFHRVSILPPPPPIVPPPSSGAQARNPALDVDQVVVPVVSPRSVIATTSPSPFQMDTTKVLDQALSHMTVKMAQGTGLSTGGGEGLTGAGSAFGSFAGSSAQLTGYLYDLKQTSEQKPTGMDSRRWIQFLQKYVATGWDDTMLTPFYRSKSPLYTDSIAISTRPSGDAPKAFGLEKEVKPAWWVIRYHARVQAPKAGDYRFSGFGDNILVVKIKGATVLDGGWDPLSSKPGWHEPWPYIIPAYAHSGNNTHNPHLKRGTIFHVDSAEVVDMDVLISDEGGICSFFLLIERMGNVYDKLPDGTPLLPFFQTNQQPAPKFSGSEEHPPYSSVPEPWLTAGS